MSGSRPMTPASDPERLGGRLHPAVLGVWLIGAVGPLLFVFVAGGVAAEVAGGMAALSAVAGVVRYLRFTWHLNGSALVIEQGLLQRQRRVIPLERVQAVELVRKLRHRLFGVVEVRVETVGGSGAEGKLDALDGVSAERLRAMLLRRSPAAPALGGDAEVEQGRERGERLVQLRPGRLVVAGLTGGRVGVAAAAFGIAQDLIGDRLERLLPMIDLTGDVRGTVLIAAVVLVGGFLLSVVATLLTYWNFTLSSDGASLQLRRGLLEQRSDTLPLRRVQALRVEENLLRRLFGLAAVKVTVAGRSGGEEGRVSELLLPLGSRREALELVERVLDRPGLGRVPLAPMPRGARDRRLVRAAIATVAVVLPALLLAGVLGAAAVVVALPSAAAALAAYRGLGHGRAHGVVVARAGWLVRRTSFVPERHLQSLALRQSPFQRRRRLATLELQIARSSGGFGDPKLIDLDERDAAALLAELAEVATGSVVSRPGQRRHGRAATGTWRPRPAR